MEGIVKAVCISLKRGTAKKNIHESELIKDFGIKNDAHGGNWHRQVSLISAEKILQFNKSGGNVKDGDFGENLIVEGIDFKSLPVGTLLKCNESVLEISQIGKDCHSHCEIFKRVGDCIMPREGVFAKVIKGGYIKEGDVMTAEINKEKKLTAAVITLSDKGSTGQRVDKSGPKVKEILEESGYEVIEYILLSDDKDNISKNLIRLSDQRQVNLIITTGGTGFSNRDNTPEATMAVMTRNAPGIAEAIRFQSMKYTKRAMLSRGVSVIRNNTLIVNLPGSEKAVSESMEVIMGTVEHGIKILINEAHDCARV